MEDKDTNKLYNGNEIRHPKTSFLFGAIPLAVAVGALALAGASAYWAKSASESVRSLEETIADQQEKIARLERQTTNQLLFRNQSAFENAVKEIISRVEQEKVLAERKRVAERYQSAMEKLPSNLSNQHIYGSPYALVSIIEFSDFECPYCRKFHPVVKELVDGLSEGVNPKLVNWRFKHYPLSFHEPNASNKAVFAECVSKMAGNRAFWLASDQLYNLAGTGRRTFGQADMEQIARIAGVSDLDALNRCMRSDRTILARIESDKALARKLNINGTPAVLIVNNQTGARQLVNGMSSVPQLVEAIKKVLPGKQQVKPGDKSTQGASAPAQSGSASAGSSKE